MAGFDSVETCRSRPYMMNQHLSSALAEAGYPKDPCQLLPILLLTDNIRANIMPIMA